MKRPAGSAQRASKLPDPPCTAEITPKHVVGWFQEAIKRRNRPTEADCIELAEYIRLCKRPMVADSVRVRVSRKPPFYDDPEVRRAMKLVLKVINDRIAEVDAILASGDPEAVRYEEEHRSDRADLVTLRAGLERHALVLCGGLDRRRRGRGRALWHFRADNIARHARTALAKAGWGQISQDADSPLVAVTCRALELTERRKFKPLTVASALRRQAQHKPPAK